MLSFDVTTLTNVFILNLLSIFLKFKQFNICPVVAIHASHERKKSFWGIILIYVNVLKTRVLNMLYFINVFCFLSIKKYFFKKIIQN